MSRFGLLRTAGRGFAVAALAVLLIGGRVTEGRVRPFVAVWLPLGLVVASHPSTRSRPSATQPHVCRRLRRGKRRREATTGLLPDPISAGIEVGVWMLASLAGSKLAEEL